MEEIATAIGLDLTDMLQEGRSLLAGTPIPTERPPTAPQAVVQPPPTPAAPDGELALLRQIAAQAAKMDKLTDELLEKSGLITMMAGKLEHKDSLLTGKDQLITYLLEYIIKEGVDQGLPKDILALCVQSKKNENAIEY